MYVCVCVCVCVCGGGGGGGGGGKEQVTGLALVGGRTSGGDYQERMSEGASN